MRAAPPRRPESLAMVAMQVSRDALHWAPDAHHWFMANVALVLLNVCVGLSS